MNICPCCSGNLLRHARHGNVYWFCRHCWQEMPECSALSSVSSNSLGTLERCFNSSSNAIDKHHSLMVLLG